MERRTIVLGGGPVGCMAALAAARAGPVLLIEPRIHQAASAPRIDAVPAPLLALLIEFGVHPAELGVSDLHDTALSAWEDADPVCSRTPAKAHIERVALERALHARVGRTRAIVVSARRDEVEWHSDARVIDATGRQAVTASRRVQPSTPKFARIFTLDGSFALTEQGFRIAALPAGYVYRLGSATLLTVGFVGGRHAVAAPAQIIESWIRESGAEWILQGLPPLAAMRSGRGGVASVQFSEGDAGNGGRTVRVGDAALARDSLSSQGIANGISDALHGLADPEAASIRRDAQLRTHLTSLLTTIRRGRFHADPGWAGYIEFLSGCMDRAPARAEG